MSAAENTPPNPSSQHEGKPLNGPPKRPSLRKPPPRPETTAPAAAKPPQVSATPESKPPPAAASEPAVNSPDDTTTVPKVTNHPIAPPSEPMQYRAIGLVRGVYQPSEEQLNRGDIVADDGATIIDSVLLGRVTSLIKKHIDLEASHLWVVYPRTRQPAEDAEDGADESGLHLQIVGIWEPDTLGLPGENPHTKAGDDDEAAVESADEASTETDDPAPTTDADDPSENYFSIRGEVLNYDEDTKTILVKIVQGSKRSNKPPKAFKLHIFGEISGKTVGYFWEFEVERQGEKLVVTDGRAIRMVPPKKKKGRSYPPRRGRRNDDGGNRPRPTRSSDKPRVKPPAPVKSNPL